MNHLDPGLLRRALDEPGALLAAQRRHLDGCLTCRRQSAVARANADAAVAALGSFAPAHTGVPPAAELPQPMFARATAVWWSAAVAAVVAAFVFTAPLRTLGQGFLAIFEPRQFVALPVSRADVAALRALPDLTHYGTMRRLVAPRMAETSDATRAARIANMPVRVPAFVPVAVRGRVTYRIVSRSTSAFTFSAAKAAATAASAGSRLLAMPPGLDGSTIQASIGPAVVGVYATRAGSFPLVVAQMPVPVVVSSGVSAATLLQYLAAQPGVPPRLVAELQAISDPTSTLPIPIPIDRMTATPVIVQGARGLGVGDETGVGAGVVWQRDGYLYGVAGSLPAQTILAIANSLR